MEMHGTFLNNEIVGKMVMVVSMIWRGLSCGNVLHKIEYM